MTPDLWLTVIVCGAFGYALVAWLINRRSAKFRSASQDDFLKGNASSSRRQAPNQDDPVDLNARNAEAAWAAAKAEREAEAREKAEREKAAREAAEREKAFREKAAKEEAARGAPKPGSTPRSWYAVLEVAASASAEEIRAAYRMKIRMYHPDRVSGLGPELQELADLKAKEINAAYQEGLRRRRGK